MASHEIIFDEQHHVYRVGGREIISVTQAIVKAGLVDTKWFTEESRIRGTAVHKAVFFDLFNDLSPDLHPVLQPYLTAWYKFKSDTNFIPDLKLCECRQFHPVYSYAGTPDLVGKIQNENWLIDIKTGEAPTARIQTAAYYSFPKIMAKNPRRASLRLKPDGTYNLIEHIDYPIDFNDFLLCLEKSSK